MKPRRLYANGPAAALTLRNQRPVRLHPVQPLVQPAPSCKHPRDLGIEDRVWSGRAQLDQRKTLGQATRTAYGESQRRSAIASKKSAKKWRRLLTRCGHLPFPSSAWQKAVKNNPVNQVSLRPLCYRPPQVSVLIARE